MYQSTAIRYADNLASVCNIIHMMSIILSIIGGFYWHCQHSIIGQIVYINAYYGHHTSATLFLEGTGGFQPHSFHHALISLLCTTRNTPADIGTAMMMT